MKPLPITETVCSTLELTPAALRIVSIVYDLARGGTTARTVVVAGLAGWSERTTRYYLARAELAGYVHRPKGVRNGWAAVGKVVFNPERTEGISPGTAKAG